MSSIASKTQYTPDDLLGMPDGKCYELVDGQLVERAMGSESSWIGGRLYRLLANYVEEQNLGWVWPADAGYRCFPGDPNKVRRPDVSFIRRGRLRGEHPSLGFEVLAPDLAVEVVSPNELAAKLEGKVDEYLQAGVQLVWVINPEARTVTVYRADGSMSRLLDHEELTGEGVVPGFRCRVHELFPTPSEPPSREQSPS